MWNLISSTEFGAAVVGALVGAMSGSLVTLIVSSITLRREQRFNDLIALQAWLTEINQWAMYALFTPKDQQDGSGEIRSQPMDSIESQMGNLSIRVQALLERLRETDLSVLFAELHRLGTELVEARTIGDASKTRVVEKRMRGVTTELHRALVGLQRTNPIRRWLSVLGPPEVRVSPEMLSAIWNVLATKDELGLAAWRWAIRTQTERDAEWALMCNIALERLHTETVVHAARSIARKSGGDDT